MKLREKAVVFLATGFYIGNIPFAPGTFGTILGLPLGFVLAGLNFPLAIGCNVLFIAIAVWIANDAEKLLNKRDPGCIVIDEIAGMAVTLVGLPFNLTTALIGFIIFRILDISKPFPIRALDKRVSGGVGIVLDDVVAGIFANLLMRLIIVYF
ncbi:Phosphatidylglycerophosphatase A (EC [Olavius sp. associated proteobacterium Delta 1]|nr:Phosphatidylglycerophosphatase A (EC [Olavius sp. associated proteobacterium Delta 1]